MSDNKDMVLSLNAGVSLCEGEGRTCRDLAWGGEEPGERFTISGPSFTVLVHVPIPAWRVLGPKVCGHHHDQGDGVAPRDEASHLGRGPSTKGDPSYPRHLT